MRDLVRRVMGRLLPWYDPALVERDAARTEAIRKVGVIARREALREQYAAMDERVGRLSGR